MEIFHVAFSTNQYRSSPPSGASSLWYNHTLQSPVSCPSNEILSAHRSTRMSAEQKHPLKMYLWSHRLCHDGMQSSLMNLQENLSLLSKNIFKNYRSNIEQIEKKKNNPNPQKTKTNQIKNTIKNALHTAIRTFIIQKPKNLYAAEKNPKHLIHNKIKYHQMKQKLLSLLLSRLYIYFYE